MIKNKNRSKVKSYIGIGILTVLALGLTGFCIFVSKNADVPIQIESISEFKNIINTGMDKHYMITGYLTFEDWEPLGDEKHPFTGVLESKHPINVKSFVNAGKKNIGLFAVNKGIIKGIKVYNPSLNDVFESAQTFGYFAGINYGEIKNCNVFMGSTEITIKGEDAAIGTLCGVNYGKITKCITTNQMIIKNENGDVNFGHICGKSLSGDIELCTGKSSATIDAKNVNAGGLCGYSSDTKFGNNHASNRLFISSKYNNVNAGGFIGCIGEKFCSISNSYNNANVQNRDSSGSYEKLKIGSIADDSNNLIKVINCVSSLSTTNLSKSTENYEAYGTFLTHDDDTKNVGNCFYITGNSSKKIYEQGTNAKYKDLSLSTLKWDSSLWKINSTGIECLIDYDK